MKKISTDFLKLNSLRSRLMLLVALAITPSLLMTVYSGWKERQNAIHAAEENLQRLTSLAATNEAQSLKSARQTLVDLSVVPALFGDPEKCRALLRTILKKNPDYANLGVIRMNGDVTCNAVPSSRRVNLADRAHFKRAIAERRFIAGNYVFGRVIQKHTINLTYPVIDNDNEVVAVVFIALDLAALDRFIGDIQFPSGSILITSDSDGVIISRRPDPEKWFGKKVPNEIFNAIALGQRQPMVLKGSDGIKRLHAFARVGTPDISNFTVTIGIPIDDIVGAASHDHFMALMTLAATTILALFATWLIGDFMIVRRVKVLVNTAGKISSGHFDARTGIQYGREEISYLARALDDMAKSLQHKQAARDKAEQELRAADRRKDEFLAMLAHELRNPLAPISAAAQVLKLGQADDAQIRATSDIIARQADHMTQLVDDLLDVSRVTRGLVTLERDTLDIRDIVSDAVEQVGPLINVRRHDLALHFPPEPVVLVGDKKRLVQVIANLLNNAAKYTPQGGHIDVRVEAQQDQVMITVADDGIGMAPELVSRVFDPFSQAERTSDRSQGGLGLGLALVKSLVELHGGSVKAFSSGAGAGSVFVVHLPLLDNQSSPFLRHGADVPLPVSARALRVMVVDDNVDAAHTLEMFVKAAGHAVVVESHAAGALARARAVAPEVCLLDIGLPDIDGNELARRLRKMPETAEAVLIAITGYGQQQDRENAMAAGFDYHFVKPVDAVKLAGLLAEISSSY